MKARRELGWDGQGILKLVLILVLGALSMLLHAYLRTKVVMTSFQVEQSQKIRARLENDFLEMKSLHENHLSAARLEKIRDRLADQGELFVEARPEQIIFISEPKRSASEEGRAR